MISPSQPRHFLFLQGMPCLFFPRLAERLRAAGARTTRLNLCLGDQLFWYGPRAVNYRGSYASWPGYIERFLRENHVTDLILLGEQRYYHREAVAIAKRLGIDVTVTDFGYLRPDWMTLERDGMSGASRFPRDPETIKALAASLPVPDWSVQFADRSAVMAKGDLIYSFSTLFGRFLFPFYRRSDRRPPAPLYFPACGLRLWSNARLKARADQFVRDLIRSKAGYYLFPLQLNYDFQIVAYSPYAGMAEAVRQVLASFASHAPAGTRLILKEHPWDPGLINWARLARRQARKLGIAERVDYLRGGDLDQLLHAAQGVVTVNSTVGIRALALGCPLKTLGQAIYDIPGLTYPDTLDMFWSSPSAPDPALAQDFIQALAGSVMIRGGYFSEPGLACAVEEASARLLSGFDPFPRVLDQNI